MSKTCSAATRGERLYPSRSSRGYWHLSQLRQAYENVIVQHRQLISDAVLVDYGCGNMPYRPLFEGMLAEYIGCDLAGNELASQILLADGRLPLDDASADIVLSSQVLEHVVDPNLYLSEALRVLRPDGLLILSTHGVWRYHPDPTDLWRWTCDGLRKEIEQCGFRVEQLRGVMGPEATALQIWQDAVAPRVHWRLKNLFYRYVQWRMQLADKRCTQECRDRDACVFVVVARKPT